MTDFAFEVGLVSTLVINEDDFSELKKIQTNPRRIIIIIIIIIITIIIIIIVVVVVVVAVFWYLKIVIQPWTFQII